MKKTLQEEKNRILEISRKINEQDEPSNNSKYYDTLKDIANSGYDQGDDFIREGEPLNTAIINYIDALEAKGLSREEIHQKLMSVVQSAIEGDKDMQQDKEDEPINQETDEYHAQYNKNMTQGFGELKEGNAFVGAAKKAKEEGKDSFELGGKTYKVTVSKTENKK
jgi:hypothetical protein